MVMASGGPLKLAILGHVDHGKSTLVGRLFHDAGVLPEGRLEQLQRAADRRGGLFEWANLTDALQSERDQNITIETAHIWFRTPQREYVLIDAPGHEEFLKNMITGAAQADAALLIVDAREGVQENSRRHAYLLHWLGIRQVIVLVNKMDLVHYSSGHFHTVETDCRNWLKKVGLEPKVIIPIAARHGCNLVSRSLNTPWCQGPTVIEALQALEVTTLTEDQPLRFPIQDVYRFDERRILAGRVESGRIKVGDRLVFSPNNKSSTVTSIERWNAAPGDSAGAGESIGITLAEQIFVKRGAVASLEAAPPYVLTLFKARVFWLGKEPFKLRRTYELKLATQEVECRIEKIEQIIDSSTLQPVVCEADEMLLGRHQVGEITLRMKRAIAFDAITEVVETGRFVIVDDCDIAGAGIILADNYPRRTANSLHKSHDIYLTAGRVTAAQRAGRNGHEGCVIWLTGLSCSGKTTLAAELERELFDMGRHVYVLDGDNARHGLCADLAFSPEDRRENIRRIGEVARLFADAGMICITAFISPYRADRDAVRRGLPPGQFLEVYLDVPIEVCEQRDVKGLYAKARSGEIVEFTGISAPYEPPTNPEIVIPAAHLTVRECVSRIVVFLMGDRQHEQISHR